MERKFLYVFSDDYYHSNRQLRCLMCPFCEVSTSCDATAFIFKVRTYFCCNNCNAFAFAKPLVRKVLPEEIQKIYPNVDIDTSVKTLWKTEFYFVSGVTSSILSLYDGYNMGPEDIVNFSKDVYDYATENNINPAQVYNYKEFLHNSKIARECKIGTEVGDSLSIPVNSFNVSKPEVTYPENMNFYCESIFFWTHEEYEQFGILWPAKKAQL